MKDATSCKAGEVPLVRLALHREKCVRLKERATTPDAVVAWVQKHYGCAPQEYFIALGLSSTMEPLGIVEVAQGGVASTHVDPRVIFSALLLMGAVGFIVLHNHPSGDAQPSSDDIALTKVLYQGSKVLSLHLFDHIVVGRGGTSRSFQTLGMMDSIKS